MPDNTHPPTKVAGAFVFIYIVFMTLSKNLKETEKLAQNFLQMLFPRDFQAKVVCLKGELGAGKTTFVQAVAKSLGIKERVTSPTFVIQKTYNLPRYHPASSGSYGAQQLTTYNKQFKKLIHIDAYRLNSGEDLKTLGWQELIEDPETLIFIEWPENVSEVIPSKTVIIEFKVKEKDQREIKIIWSPKTVKPKTKTRKS